MHSFTEVMLTNTDEVVGCWEQLVGAESFRAVTKRNHFSQKTFLSFVHSYSYTQHTAATHCHVLGQMFR